MCEQRGARGLSILAARRNAGESSSFSTGRTRRRHVPRETRDEPRWRRRRSLREGRGKKFSRVILSRIIRGPRAATVDGPSRINPLSTLRLLSSRFHTLAFFSLRVPSLPRTERLSLARPADLAEKTALRGNAIQEIASGPSSRISPREERGFIRESARNKRSRTGRSYFVMLTSDERRQRHAARILRASEKRRKRGGRGQTGTEYASGRAPRACHETRFPSRRADRLLHLTCTRYTRFHS